MALDLGAYHPGDSGQVASLFLNPFPPLWSRSEVLPRSVMRIVLGKGHGRRTIRYLAPCETQRELVLVAVFIFMVIIIASLILVGVTSSLPDVCFFFPLL